MSTRYLLILALLSCLCTVKAQQPVVIPLTLHPGNGPFPPSSLIGIYIPDPGSEFKLNPRIMQGALWRFNFAPGQSLANYLYVYSGWDGQGNFLIVPDRNHNKDFNDDSALVYKYVHYRKNEADSMVKTLPYETVHIPVWQPDATHDVPITLRFVPGYLLALKMSNPKADTSKITIELYEYASGRADIEGTEQSFYVALNGQTNFQSPGKETYRIFTTNEAGFSLQQPVLRYFLNKVGDTIPVGNGLYALESIDWIGNKLSLRYAGVNQGLGIIPGTIAKNFDAEDILTRKPIQLSDFSGKYVLMDFWGTWCIPCKETVPGLKNLDTSYRDLKIISIALDDKLESVVGYLKNEGITWSNIFEDRKNSGPKISDIYNVQNYPTFILLDRKGRIIFREYGLPGFADLEKMLRQLLPLRSFKPAPYTDR